MTDTERRRRPRIRWLDRSIRTKALLVMLSPIIVLCAAVIISVSVAPWPWLRSVDTGLFVLATGSSIVLWHFFTTGVVERLRDLEQDTGRFEGVGTPLKPLEPVGRDEIGRLASRLEDAADQVRIHAEEAAASRAELTDILTASPVVSLRYDVASRSFTYASANCEDLLGLSPEQVLSDASEVETRFHPDDQKLLRQALVEGRGQHDDRLSIVLRCRKADDAPWHEVDALYAVEADERGKPLMVSSYLVDVSAFHAAQRAAEERRQTLESIFHASPDTIVVRDVSGRVLLASSPAAALVGVEGAPATSEEHGAAASGSGRLRREDVAALEDLVRRCMEGERDLAPVITTGREPAAEGGYTTFETRARPILDEQGRVTGTVTVSRDITERIRLEQSLRRATVAAERASEAKSQFLSRMSHELRTPLNAILGFAQLLELDELPPDQSSSVEHIQRAGHHLLALINEVLDIARIEAGQLSVSPEAVCVGDVLDDVTALLAPVAEAAAVHMMVEPGEARSRYVRADRQRLRQVLLNLGSNAVKYNEAGGTIAFRTAAVGGNRVRFSVHDTGPGIAPEQQDLLFVPFSRLGAERSGVEGTGVGLALSKQLVEVMGGTIGVDSAPGHGSTFWVELLAAPVPEAAPDWRAPAAKGAEGPFAPASAAEGADRRKPKLLVLQVEDDPSNASLVSLVLARRPEIRLLSAEDAHLGLELARQHRPDLILLDLHLPDLPGDEMLYRVKAIPELADTKVVVVSADATPERIRRMLDQGVDGYLTKPVDVTTLLQLVDDQLARHSPAVQ